MSLVDHTGQVEYPYSLPTVFKAIMEAAPNISGLSLDSADEMSGRVTFKAGVSLASWGENIPVQLVRITDTRTRMEILSTPKTGIMFGGAMDFGKNRQNIEKIINAVSAVLSTKPKEQPKPQAAKPVASTADELLKLKQLKDEGILSAEEFEAEKQKILKGEAPVSASVSQSEAAPETSEQSEQPLVHIDGSSTSASSKAVIGIIAIIFIVIFFALIASM